MPISLAQLHGLDKSHLAFSERFGCLLHPEAAEALGALADQAKAAAIELKVASGFRSFERQLAIWEGKCSGRMALMDHRGDQALELAQLSPAQTVEAILRWSALPGASRHHWGTDMDIYDGAAIGPDYRLQLTPWEYSENGPFAALVKWLEKALPDTAFYRPFDGSGGVGAEPWHISYRPLASRCERKLTPRALAELISHQEMSHRPLLLSQLPELYRRYIAAI
ncbi:MAG: M15 family metallopeptidase [Cellvibrionaceae bacterium]|nr:M15 family metallopeptidase [Cellvibrionaceae bacterium]